MREQPRVKIIVANCLVILGVSFLTCCQAWCQTSSATTDDNSSHPEPAQARPGATSLRAGLVMPVQHKRTVTTSQAMGYCDKGSLLFYVDTGRDVAFYNLHSLKADDVRIVVGKRHIKMLPGEQVLVTSNTTGDFTEVNPGKGITFRNPKLVHEVDRVRVFSADFSIPTAVACIKPLKAMLKSEDTYERKLINNVLTDAVILAKITGGRGPFTPSKF